MDILKIKNFIPECNPTVDPVSMDRWISRATNPRFGRKRRALGRKRFKHYRGCLLRAFGYKAMPEVSLYWTP